MWLLQLTNMVVMITTIHDYGVKWLFLITLGTVQKENEVLRKPKASLVILKEFLIFCMNAFTLSFILQGRQWLKIKLNI